MLHRPFIFGTVWIMLGLTACAGAAEIRLRPHAEPAGGIVLLGEVAEVRAASVEESEQLRQIELVPAPAAGATTYLRVRELQDLLHARGVNLAQHHFSGASRVALQVSGEAVETPTARPLTSSTRRSVGQDVQQALLAYLNARVNRPRPWQLAVELDDEQAATLAAARGELEVAGGTAPYTGVQQFTLTAATDAGTLSLPVVAQVTLPASVVVAVRPLGRGVTVQSGDVELRPHQPVGYSATVKTIHSLDDVVGQETTRAIAAGQVLDEQDVQPPVLVRSGDVVTVYARSAGIQVRTTARARETGSLGALITVESLTDRSRFYARVAGPQVVDVYARGASLPGAGNSLSAFERR